MIKDTQISKYCMFVSTHTDQMRALICSRTHTYSTNSQPWIKLKPFMLEKQLDHWDISKSWHFSRFIMDIQNIPTRMHPVATLATAMCYLAKKGKKPQSTSSYKERAFEGIRMHIDITGPWAITGLIFLPDKQSASLWAFSWHLTSAFPTEPSLLMQKTKCLRGLLNIQYLNCLTIIFFFNSPFKDSISEWMQRMAIEERALRDAEEEE